MVLEMHIKKEQGRRDLNLVLGVAKMLKGFHVIQTCSWNSCQCILVSCLKGYSGFLILVYKSLWQPQVHHLSLRPSTEYHPQRAQTDNLFLSLSHKTKV